MKTETLEVQIVMYSNMHYISWKENRLCNDNWSLLVLVKAKISKSSLSLEMGEYTFDHNLHQVGGKKKKKKKKNVKCVFFKLPGTLNLNLGWFLPSYGRFASGQHYTWSTHFAKIYYAFFFFFPREVQRIQVFPIVTFQTIN